MTTISMEDKAPFAGRSPRRTLVFNSLDARYGSTYRARALNQLLQDLGLETNYVEGTGYPMRDMSAAVRRLFSPVELVFVQKFNPVTLPVIALARLMGIPVIVDWDDLDTDLQRNFINRILTAMAEFIGPRIVTGIVTHNSFLEAQAIKLGVPVHIVPQGFDEQLFRPDRSLRSAVRKTWGIPDSDQVVGYLCTLTHGGTLDLQTLLEAFRKIQSKNIHLVILGGGPMEGHFRALIARMGLESNTHITGLVPHERIPAALSAFDCGVIYMSDRRANEARVSFKVIEYLAMDVPVVGRVVGETERRFGAFVHHAGIESLPEAIERILSSPPPPTAHFVAEYSWSHFLDTLRHSVTAALKGEPCH